MLECVAETVVQNSFDDEALIKILFSFVYGYTGYVYRTENARDDTPAKCDRENINNEYYYVRE